MSYPVLYSQDEEVRYPAIAGVAVAGLSIVGDETDHPSAFTDQGLGTLTDAISCTVNEKRNAEYELTMQYPVSGVHFAEIAQRCIIKAKPNYTDVPQPFRIYKITKPLNGVCTIYARHLSYDLSGFEIPAGLTASGAVAAAALLSTYAPPFTVNTTLATAGTFKTDMPASIRSWFGGKQGSMIDLFGGEWHYDRYTCSLKSARGQDRGVTIRYGKNLTVLTQDETSDGIYTAVRAYYDNDGTPIVSDMVTTNATIKQTRILFLDATSYFGTDVPSKAQLNSYASAYINSHNLSVPDANITLDFVQLEGLAERVDLCDTVTVVYEALGISAQKKCIEVTWDVLKERYIKAVFGTNKMSVSDTVAVIQDKAEKAVTPSFLDRAVAKATQMITGNLGGYVVMHDNDGDGEPDELLIMDTPDINTATKVWRWNQAGLGFSSTGYDGQYGLAMTADGEIVADFIKTGQLTAIAMDNGNGTFVVDSDGHVIAKEIEIQGGRISIETNDDEDDYIRLNKDNKTTSMTPYKFSVIYNGTRVASLAKSANDNHGGLFLYNVSGDNAVSAGTTSSGLGGYVNVKEFTNGNTTAHLSNDANGGTLQVNDTGGDMRIRGEVETNGGQLRIFNSNDKRTIMATNSANGGYINVYNADETLRLALSDWVDVYNAGTRNIRLNGVNGEITCVSLTQTSDRARKTEIKALDGEKAERFILGLKPSEFAFKGASGTHHGFIAQDVEEVADWDIVRDDEGTKVLAYNEIIADLVATVQRQNERIEALERKLNE